MSALRRNNFIKPSIIFFIFILTVVSTPILFINISLSYTKNDYIRYNIFTFEEIKGMPFISSDYKIYYDSPDGSKPMINEVFFFNTTSDKKSALVNYIESIGFQRSGEDLWIKNKKTASIKRNDAENTISISIEKN
ncbi:hypothetical protein BM451_18730 [Dickeya dadantii]|nr:hypothetical protein BM451_18730 [Dickeya dadantii]